MNLDEIDPTFVADLEGSVHAAHRTGEFLEHTLGLQSRVMPTVVRPDPSVRAQYADAGDIRMTMPVEVSVMVESKGRQNIQFSCARDFPYRTIMVDIKHTHDKKFPKPFYYFIWNTTLTTVAVVNCHTTRSYWTVEAKTFHGRSQECYFCPVDRLEFVQFDAAKTPVPESLLPTPGTPASQDQRTHPQH